MVCINTYFPEIRFTHFVKVPSSACLIGTAYDSTNRLKLYLVVDDNGPIYKRNGINNTWEQLDRRQKEAVRTLVMAALADSRIPQYSTDGLSVLN